MSEIQIEFGKRVYRERKSRKLSQEQLAELSDLHYTTIGEIERGETTPSLDTIAKIAKGMKISISQLMINIEGICEEKRSIPNEVYAIVERQSKGTQQYMYDVIVIMAKMPNL